MGSRRARKPTNGLLCTQGKNSPKFAWQDSKHKITLCISRLYNRQSGIANDGEAHQNGKSFDFVASLRACAKNKDLCTGIKVHDDVRRRGLLQKCSSALVTMYAKCGALLEAKQLMDVHKIGDIFSWTAVIAAFAQKGQGEQAILYFQQMKHQGLSPDAVTYSFALQACGSIRAINEGKKIHDEIAKQGLLGKNIVLGNALVNMYAKCGALEKAHQVLEELTTRNVLSWNTLIAGYVEHGTHDEALNCLEQMRSESISPDAVTFISILKSCGSVKAADQGEKIHEEISKQGLLQNSVILGNALVSMYAKCGALSKARQVLEDLPVRDVTSWNALIAGCIDLGKEDLALICLQQMRDDGVSPDAVTFTCILRACGSTRALEKGINIHKEVAEKQLLENNVVLGGALVDMYAKCGALENAHRVLEQLPVRNSISWNALIAGYAEHGTVEQALNCAEQMQHEGLCPTAVTYSCMLKACGNARAADKGAKIHDEIAHRELLRNNNWLGNSLVSMYAKCGVLSKARQVLEELPSRDVVSWTSLIIGYAEHGEGGQALSCLKQMQHEGLSPSWVTFLCILKACSCIEEADQGGRVHQEIAKHGWLPKNVVLGTALVDMYAKCSAFTKARETLDELFVRNVVSWNALIAGFAQHGETEQVLKCIEQMQQEGIIPNAVTYTCLLKGCSISQTADIGGKIHEEIAQQGLMVDNAVFLGTALINMYAKCGAPAKAQHVHEQLPVRDTISWNALIMGYAQSGEGEQALKLYDQMKNLGLSPSPVTYVCALKACGSIGAVDKGEELHEEIVPRELLKDNVVLGTALVDMYARCGALAKARRLLEELPGRDVISWNALIARYAEIGDAEQAWSCFEQMGCEGFSPYAATFLSILKACGSIGAGDKGEALHDQIAKQGLLQDDVLLGTAVLDMYAKCGALGKACHVLEELPAWDAVSWTALIAGFANHGEGDQALDFLEGMPKEGLSPNAATFSCVLSACSRLGLVEAAQMCFGRMSTKHGVNPNLEHYTCMVDLFGRAGNLDKAVGVIEKMAFADSAVWSAVLGACRKWGDVEVGRWAFDCGVQGDASDAGVYVLMASIYAAAGMPEDAAKIEALRIENRAWKRSGLGMGASKQTAKWLHSCESWSSRRDISLQCRELTTMKQICGGRSFRYTVHGSQKLRGPEIS